MRLIPIEGNAAQVIGGPHLPQPFERGGTTRRMRGPVLPGPRRRKPSRPDVALEGSLRGVRQDLDLRDQGVADDWVVARRPADPVGSRIVGSGPLAGVKQLPSSRYEPASMAPPCAALEALLA